MRMIMVSPGLPNSSNAKNITMIKSKKILTLPFSMMTMVGMMVDWVKKWKKLSKKSRKPQSKFEGWTIECTSRILKMMMLD